MASSGFSKAATSLVAAPSKLTRRVSGRVPLVAAAVKESIVERADSILKDDFPTPWDCSRDLLERNPKIYILLSIHSDLFTVTHAERRIAAQSAKRHVTGVFGGT